MKILLGVITILVTYILLYGLIYGGTQKTKEEQEREDEEQARAVREMWLNKFDSPEKWLERREHGKTD